MFYIYVICSQKHFITLVSCLKILEHNNNAGNDMISCTADNFLAGLMTRRRTRVEFVKKASTAVKRLFL